MDSFEELGISPELVEALAAEGIERPTPLQETVIPLVRRGNNLVLAAGAGSGLLVAWAMAVLERIDDDGRGPRVLVLTAGSEGAEGLAESLARLTQATGHTVAALGSPWVLPGHAQFLFGSPQAVLAAASSGHISLAGVQVLVVDQAHHIESLIGLGTVEQVMDFLPPEAQRLLSALPVTTGVSDFVERHLKRAMTVPQPGAAGEGPQRGDVRFRIVPEPREDATLSLVDEILSDDVRHVLMFFRSDDRAADVGDRLALHGYHVGAPGDESVPVWLGVDALEARTVSRNVGGVVVLSCDVPPDPDTLDRRHSISPGGVITILPREVTHLRDLARRTGYTLTPFPPPRPPAADSVEQLRHTLERALETEDTGPYLLALAPLFERHDPAEVAAAAVALLRKKEAPTAPLPVAAPPRAPGASQSWAKLFIGVGTRDGLVPGDLLGTITGEAGVPGEAVGRIDIKESHTVVEVHDAVAQKVIKAINGTTIRGRAVRADFDRPRKPAGRGRTTRSP